MDSPFRWPAVGQLPDSGMGCFWAIFGNQRTSLNTVDAEDVLRLHSAYSTPSRSTGISEFLCSSKETTLLASMSFLTVVQPWKV
mgnify:FL=1